MGTFAGFGQASVWIAAGGTGGHIFPALAIAQALGELSPGVALAFVGAQGGMETRLVPAAGYPLYTLPIKGLQRSLRPRALLRNLRLPFQVGLSVWRMRQTLRQSGARLVVGTGGYASMPALAAARWLGLPYALNEQNAFPGLVTRVFARRARAVYAGNPAVAAHLGGATVQFTGNPVRGELLRANELAFQREARTQLGFDDRPVVLVVGGSLGAATLNRAVLAGQEVLEQAAVQVLWQCGRTAYPALGERVRASNVRLVPFIDDMAQAYAASDLVVCRAGALTLAELAVLGKPSILIPSPNVADDHQTHNARSFHTVGAAELLPDAEAEGQLVPRVLRLLQDPARRAELSRQAAALGRPTAATDIARHLLTLL